MAVLPIGQKEVKRQLLTAGTEGNNLTYAIKVDPANPLCGATAKISVGSGTHKLTSQDIQWHNFEKIPMDSLRHWTLHEKTRFNVKIDRGKGISGFIVHITLRHPGEQNTAPEPENVTQSLSSLEERLKYGLQAEGVFVFSDLKDVEVCSALFDREFEGKVEEALNSRENKIVLIQGDYGSGKTFFSKNYVLKRLKSRIPTQPLALFISLITLQDPVKGLMDEVLSQLKLLECKEYLRNRPIQLFCDGLDEMYMNRKKPDGTIDNLYQTNNLAELWPNLQLVMTCSPEFLDLPKGNIYFWPESNGRFQKIVMPLFNSESSMVHPISQALQVLQKDRAMRNFIWTKPLEYFKYISSFQLENVVFNPFYFFIMLISLPSIVDRMNQTNEIKAQLTSFDLLEEYVCLHFRLDLQKQHEQGSFILYMVEYFHFALELSRTMNRLKTLSLTYLDIESSDLNERWQKYLYDNSSESNLRRGIFLIENRRVQFIHFSIYEFFRTIDSDIQLKHRIEKRLEIKSFVAHPS